MKHQFLKKLAVFALAAGMLLPIAGPAVQAKAETKEAVWVLSSQKGEDGFKITYKYNTKGLLTVEKQGDSSVKYTYKGTKISKRSTADTWSSGKYVVQETYTYNKDGSLAKKVSASDSNDITKYTWKNGRCTKQTLSSFGITTAYTYDKNGYIAKFNTDGDIWTLKYDKNGYTLSVGSSYYTELVKNTYKDGRLASRSYLDENGNVVDKITFTYKKIKVPSSYVEQVKRQQEWLTNKGGMQYLPLAAY